MKVSVKVRPGAGLEKIEEVSKGHFNIWVKASAKEGKANEAALQALARYLKIAPSLVKIISGHKSKNKIFEIK